METNTDIDKVSNALVQFSAVEAGLAELRKTYANVVYPVATTAGMADAKAARLALREPRYKVEQIRKDAKAPLIALGKKLDADAARITAEITALEDPIDQQIKLEEDRKEREKQEKIAAEAARVQKIQDRITNIRGAVSVRFGDDAAMVLQHISDIESEAIDESFAEFQETAAAAKLSTLARLREIHAGILERIAREEQIKAERAELERLRAEQKARDDEKAEADRKERQRLKEAAAAEQREIDARNAAIAEENRLAREAIAEQQRQQQAVIDAENSRIAKERADLERQQAELKKAQEPPKQVSRKRKVERPTDDAILNAVATAFGVTMEIAAKWIAEMGAEA